MRKKGNVIKSKHVHRVRFTGGHSWRAIREKEKAEECAESGEAAQKAK